MPHRKPLIFSDNFIAPIVCTNCGHNAYCVRREPHEGRERQTFECPECRQVIARLTGDEPSDEEIQTLAERQSGISASGLPS